jgi:hypothetical protein
VSVLELLSILRNVISVAISVTVFLCCNKASKLAFFLVHGTLRLLSLSGSCYTITLSSSRVNHLASCFMICLVRSSVVMRLG